MYADYAVLHPGPTFRYSNLSMNQCVQVDNTDNFESLLYHIDDNNKYPARGQAAGPGYWNDLDCLMLGYVVNASCLWCR